VTAQLEGLPINPFTVGLVGEAMDAFIPRPRVLPVYQHGDENLAAVFSEAPGELALGSKSREQSNEHFGSLVGVGNGDDPGGSGRPWLNQESFPIHTFEDRPADWFYGESVRLDEQGVAECIGLDFQVSVQDP